MAILKVDSMWLGTASARRFLAAAAMALPLFVLGCGGPGDGGGEGQPTAAAPEPEEPGAGTAPPAAPAGSPPAAPASGPATRLSGVDVSQFQGEIDWQAVKAGGVVFAYARALEGETLHDSRFAANWQGMKEAGVIRGAYDFYVADDPPAAQVEAFAALVTLEPGDLVPMVDIEQGSIGSAAPPGLVVDFHSYLELMESHYGVKPIIYTDPDFWNEHMDDSFGDYPLWIADYDVDSPTLPEGWTSWVIWQHSDSGSVPGIDGAVDLDRFNGGLEELAKYRVP